MSAQPRLATELMNRIDTIARLTEIFESLSERLSPDLAEANDAEGLSSSLASPLAATVGETARLFEQLEDELGAGDGGDGKLDWDLAFEMTPLPGDGASATPIGIARDLSAHAADVCFAARGELRRVARSLGQPRMSYQALLDGCERARRKVRRAIAAVLDAAARASGEDSALAVDHDAELAAAIAVRAMYAKYRQRLIPCDESRPSAVNRALRYAAVAIAQMVGSPEFADVRLADRRMVLDLQSRVLRWARGNRGADGVRLYKDICTAADLLAAISQRQELKQHDTEVVADACARLRGSEDDVHEVRAVVSCLADVQGRDDALDVAVRAAAAAPDDRARVAALASELERVKRELVAAASAGAGF